MTLGAQRAEAPVAARKAHPAEVQMAARKAVRSVDLPMVAAQTVALSVAVPAGVQTAGVQTAVVPVEARSWSRAQGLPITIEAPSVAVVLERHNVVGGPSRVQELCRHRCHLAVDLDTTLGIRDPPRVLLLSQAILDLAELVVPLSDLTI